MSGLFGDTPLGLTSQVLNLAAALTRKQLKIPRYQRPYTWTDREVRELIQDLRRAYERGATFYFIGQIVLIKNHGKLEVSDGQQRLATLTMLLAYTRDRIPNRAKQYQTLIMNGDKPRLLLREEDANFYLGYVQEPGRMKELARHPEIGIESRDLIAAAAATIENELEKYSDNNQLDAFMSYVARACTLNVVDADERGSAQTVFNTLNKRGSPLSGADIIKSDLLENSRLSDAEAEEAAAKWEQTEDLFPRENFARLLYMMPFLLTGEPLLSPGDLASFRTAVDRAGGVRTFLLEQLPSYAHALRAIYAGKLDLGAASAEVNRRVAVMKQVDAWDCAPCALAFLTKHAGDHERARKFFQALERFTFACEFGVIENAHREARYANIIKYVHDDRVLHSGEGRDRAFALTDGEYQKFFATLDRAKQRDRQRRLLLMWIEASMPNGNVLSLTDDATVEHILPRAGSRWWNQRFPDPKLRKDLANLIGNQTLLTFDQNQRAGAEEYPVKREVYFNTKTAPIHVLTKDIAPIEEWTLEAIEERHQRLIRILCEYLGVIRAH